MADSIEDRLSALRATAPAGSPLYTAPGAIVPVQRSALPPAAPNPANAALVRGPAPGALDLSAWQPAPDTGGLDLSAWRSIPDNASIDPQGPATIGPDGKVTGGWLDTPARLSQILQDPITPRQARREAMTTFRQARTTLDDLERQLEEESARLGVTPADVQRMRDELEATAAPGAMLPEFDPMGRFGRLVELDGQRRMTEAEVERLRNVVVTGQGLATQTGLSSAVNNGLDALFSAPDYFVRAAGEFGDAVQFFITGDTTENHLVQVGRAMQEAIDEAFAGDPARQNEFFGQVATGFGSFAGMWLGGLAGRAAGSVVNATRAGGTVGGLLGGAAPVAVEMVDEALNAGTRMFDDAGVPLDAEATRIARGMARYQAFLAGLAIGGTEVIPLSRLFDRLDAPSQAAMRRFFENAGTQAGEEAIQEFTQSVLQDVAAQRIYDPNRTIDWQSALNNAGIGAIVGGAVGGIGAALTTPPREGGLTNNEQVGVEAGIETAIEAGAPPTAPPGAPGTQAGGPSPVGPSGAPTAAPSGVAGGPAAPAPAAAPAAVPPVAGAPTEPQGDVASRRVQRSGSDAIETIRMVDGSQWQRTNGGPWSPVAGAQPARPLPVAGDSLPAANAAPPVAPAGVGAGLAPPPVAVANPPSPVEVGTLIAAGYLPDDIADMDPAERAEAMTQAIDQGVPQQTAAPEQMAAFAPVQPVAEPEAPPVEAPQLDLSAWTPATPEAPNVAIQSGEAAAEPVTQPAPDANGIPVGGDVPRIPAAPAGVAGGPESLGLPPDRAASGFRAGPRQATPRAGADTRVADLLTFIAMNGGIRPTPELRTINAHVAFVPGRGRFVGPRGIDVDRMRELVAEAGYFGGDTTAAIARTTPADLYDLIDRALRGNLVAPDTADDQAAVARKGSAAREAAYADRVETEILAWMQAEGVDDPAWLKRATEVAIASGVEADLTDEKITEIMERAAISLIPPDKRKVVADDIPFDLHPDDLRPRDAAPSGGEAVRGGGQGEPSPVPGAGEPQGQAGEGGPAPAVDRTEAGQQFVIPGAEKISDAEQAQNLADKPLRPTVDQKPADDGLFGDSAAQMDLVDLTRKPEPQTAAPAPQTEPAPVEDGRLTTEGPWDFENTYPDIDRAQYERLLNERPDPFDAAGEPSSAQITEMIDAILSDLQGRHTSILAAQAEIASAKPADKKKLEAEVAGTFESIKGLGEEMRGIWSGDAVNAILGAGRKRAAAERKGTEPKPAAEKKPAAPAPQAEEPATAPEPAPEVKQPPSRERPAIFYPSNEETPLVQRLLGEGFKTIVSARTFARQNDERAEEAKDEKHLDEIIEAAVVSAARRIVREGGGDQAAIYKRLVQLYDNQPKLAVRTAKSMGDQAYSTPVPLAYLASRLAGVEGAQNLYEPTAGNGALLVEDLKMVAFVNEIDETRRKNLREGLGYNSIGQDATEAQTTEYAVRHSRVPKVRKLEGNASRVPFDVVLMNPPFGSVREDGGSKEWTVVGDYRTAQIDHAIALNALQAMKDDGKAVLIVGGVNPQNDRQEGYRASSKRKFYARLYKDYRVVDHFTVAGPLYARQGAGWPVDVIVINGRGQSARALPAADVPALFTSWDDLAAKLPGTAAEKPALGANTDKHLGFSATGKDLFEDSRGVRYYVEDGVRHTEPVAIVPGGSASPRDGISVRRPPTSDNFRLTAEAPTAKPQQTAPTSTPDGFAVRDARRSTKEEIEQERRKGFPGREFTVVVERRSPYGTERGFGTTPDEARQDALRRFTGAASTPTADDFDSAFDSALDDAFGKATPKKAPVALTPEREAAWQKKAAAVNAAPAAPAAPATAAPADAMRDLAKFFNDPSNFGLGVGVGFDPAIYAKIKPMLVKAAAAFKDLAGDATALVKAMVAELRDAYQMTREAVERIRPYMRRFMDDLTSGAVTLDAEPTPAPVAAAPVQPKARAPRSEATANDAGQVPYAPYAARGMALDTLQPANLRQGTEDALKGLEARVGDLDAFVGAELGYQVDAEGMFFMRDGKKERPFSAEQVDALALAIDNAKKGASLVLGDQTGIGKGRVGAGMLRWAKRQGYIPVFFTEKPDLFGDMYRDLTDIGADKIDYYMTNVGASIPLNDAALEWTIERDEAKAAGEPRPKRPAEAKWFSSSGDKGKVAAEGRAVIDGKRTPDVVFTTYDQVNDNARGDGTQRRQFFEAIGPRAFFVLDEAHNAGGQEAGTWKPKPDKDGRVPPEPRAQWMRGVLRTVKAGLYMSATYAKRPDTMTLYNRTDMPKAVDKAGDLPELISRGGVPLQQIVAGMLGRAGQYLRRERSFAGINYTPEVVPVSEEAYRDFTDAIGAIYRFDRAVAPRREEYGQAALDRMGASKARDGSIGDAAADSTEFAAIMHNIVNQMLLSITSDAVATKAIEALREGRKPVIGLSNTMESFLVDYVTENGLAVGSEVGISFKDVMRRYLSRTLRITIKNADDEKSYIQIPVTDLPADLQAQYHAVEETLESAAISDFPVSPIDHIRGRLTKAGYSVAEVTGRQMMLDYSGNVPVLMDRPQREVGPAGKRSSISAFNNGKLDVLILNKSGSTGVSAHASPKVGKDTRPRRMIIAQADPNIDVYMQMLGRVNRTGQINLPDYIQAVPDVPAAMRPMAVLMKKMASLNANTTGARSGTFSANDVDIMNKYGDIVATQVMIDAPDWNERMGDPVAFDDKGKPVTEEPLRRVMGRMTLIRPDEQADLLDQLQSSYKALIERLEAAGENALEAKTLDLQAIVKEAVVVREAKGPSPFEGEVKVERLSVKSPGRSMAPDEVLEAAAAGAEVQVQNLRGATTAAKLDYLPQQARYAFDQKVDAALEAGATWAKADAGRASKEKRNAVEKRHEAVAKRFRLTTSYLTPGSRVSLKITEDANPVYGVVLRVERQGKTKNPLALSSWAATIAVPDSQRMLSVPLSQLYPPGAPKGDEVGFDLSHPDYTVGAQQVVDMFEAARKEGREDRAMVTGNILSGYDESRTRGQIVNFTMEDGTERPGILMPRGYTVKQFLAARAIRFPTGGAIREFLRNAPEGAMVESQDGYITIIKSDGAAPFFVSFDGTKSKGGRYFLDKGIGAAVGGANRIVKGAGKSSGMNVFVSGAQLDAMVPLAQKAGASFLTTEHQAIAETATKGLAEKDRRDVLTGDIFAPEQKPAKPKMVLSTAPIGAIVGHVDLGPLPLAFNGKADFGATAREYVLARGRATGVEHTIAILRDGTVVGHGYGSQRSTGMTGRIDGAIRTPGAGVVIHHNHPRNASLSYVDISCLAMPGLKAVWAHGHGGFTSRAEATEAFKKRFETTTTVPVAKAAMAVIDEAFLRGLKPLYDAHGRDINAGSIAPDEASRQYSLAAGVAGRLGGAVIFEHSDPSAEAALMARYGAEVRKAGEFIKAHLFNGVTDASFDRPADPARHFADMGGAPDGTALDEARGGRGGQSPDGSRADGRGQARPVASGLRRILPGRRSDLGHLANDIQALIGRMAGPKVKVKFADQIAATDSIAGSAEMERARAEAGVSQELTIGGSYKPNLTIPAEALIEVALSDPDYDPKASATHEIWHHIEFALLTEEELQLIRRDLASPNSTLIAMVAQANNISYAAAAAMPSYEITANAFQIYVERKEKGQPLRGFHIGLRRAFDRLLELFRAIKRTLGRRGVLRVEDIFETARVGAMRGRTTRQDGALDVEATEEAYRAGRGEAASSLFEDPLAASLPSRPIESYWQQRTGGFLARARRSFTRDTADAIRVKTQDSMLKWKRIEQAIEADTGAKIGGGMQAYLTQSLFSGRAGERLDDLRRKHLEPLIEAMRKAEVDPRSLGLYLYARHAFERNAEISKINPGYRDKNGDWAGAVDPTTGEPNGSGMTDREAQAILDAIGAKLPTYEALADQVYAIRDWSLDVMVRFGLLSREQADEWISKYPDYVPLRGFETNDGENVDRPRVGRGFDLRTSESKRALGRGDIADNPLAYVIMQAQQAIVRSEKNRVLRTVLNLINANPNDAIWRVVKSVPERYVDEETGLVRTRFVPPPGWSEANRDAFHGVKIGGKVTWIEFKGDIGAGLSRALRGVGREQSAIVQAMMKMSRGWAMLQTTLNPEFVFTNFLRDLPAAVINVTDVDGRPLGTRRKILTDALTLKSIRGIRRAMKGKANAGEVGRYYEEFRSAGGKISFIELNDVDRIKARIDKAFTAGNIRRAIWAAGDWIDGVNTAVENSARLSVYIALRKHNFAKDAAASVARELTVNFNRKGEWGPVLNSLYIFFNASTQGTFRMASAIAKSKKVRRIVYGIVAYGFLSEFLNAFLDGDDDEYDQIPDYVKERNMIFMLGSGGARITIPMPYGYNVFYLAGQQLAATIRGVRSPSEAIGSTLLAALDAFNPIGTAPTIGQLLSPTLLDPVVQISENRTWYGGNVAPTKFDQSKPDSQNFWTDTPEGYVDIARVLNEATGGTVGRAGWVDISPETVEHVVDFGIGGAGRFIANTVNGIRSLIEGEEIAADDIPIARRLIAFPTASSSRHAFWEAWDVIDQAYYETNEYRRQGMAEQFNAATETYARELAVWRTFDRTRRAMNDIREAVTLTERDRTISGAERAERIERFEAQERELIEAAIQAYEGAAN